MNTVDFHNFVEYKKAEIKSIEDEILLQKMAQYNEAGTDCYGNVVAEHGCTRCACGSKYWELDKCVGCGYIIK